MKIMKKILSSVMALTMAASALCVSASAKTMNNGEHLYYTEMNRAEYAGNIPEECVFQLSFGAFDAKEMKEINAILDKGHKVVISSNFTYPDVGDLTFYAYVDKKEGVEIIADFSPDVVSVDGKYEWVDVNGGKEFRTLIYSYDDIAMRDGVTQILAGLAGANEDYEMYAIESGNNEAVWFYALNDPSMQAAEKDISKLTISKISNKSYTGKAVKPAVTIKDGDKKLVKGTDYTVSYKNNTKIGTATVTIKGKGNYTGTKTLTFKIVPAKTTLKVSKKSDTKATFSWTAVKGAEKYQLYYSVDGGKTYKKYTTISGSKTSYTTSKLNFKKYDYKFKIRAYDKVDKTTYYGSYSKIVSVK